MFNENTVNVRDADKGKHLCSCFCLHSELAIPWHTFFVVVFYVVLQENIDTNCIFELSHGWKVNACHDDELRIVNEQVMKTCICLPKKC